MTRRLAVVAALVVAIAACETGQVDRDRFDAMVNERDDATRRLVEAVTENDQLRDEVDRLTADLDELRANSPVVDLVFWRGFLAEWDAAWSASDLDRIMALYAPDAVVELAVAGIVRRGADSVREFNGEFLDRYQRFALETELFEAREDRVLALWEGSGVRQDGSLDLLAGGTLLEVVDGLIVRQVDYAVFD